jgi:hypothetical protein
MARRGLGPADWLVLAVTPALLVSLVSCLLFFIVDILYRGRHGGRMEWILFFSTLGMVLIGRVRLIDEIAKRAGLYSAALGGLVWIGLSMYIPPPDGWPFPAHIAAMGALVALGFWVTRILVLDTTDLNDNDEIEGQGLLAAGGLEDDPAERLRAQVENATGRAHLQKIIKPARIRRPPGGVVVLFCLVTLPLFGLGQALIPVSEPERRWRSLLLLMGYLGSGFLLLLTCCFLGLRRYVARRGISMPPSMAAAWLGTGSLVVGIVLLGALLIPRPADTGGIVALFTQQQSPAKATKKESGGFHQDDAKSTGSGNDKNAKTPDKNGKGKDQAGKQSGSEKGPDAKKESGDNKRSDPPKNDTSAKDANPNMADRLSELMSGIMPILKMIVAAAIVVMLVLFLAWRAAMGHSNTDWVNRWLGWLFKLWDGLLGRTSKRPIRESESLQIPAESWKPFGDFSNPFTGRYPLDGPELVREVFAGVVAWGRDKRLPPRMGETAREFSKRMGNEYPALEEGLQKLANLVDQVEYAPESPVVVQRESLQELWILLKAS